MRQHKQGKKHFDDGIERQVVNAVRANRYDLVGQIVAPTRHENRKAACWRIVGMVLRQDGELPVPSLDYPQFQPVSAHAYEPSEPLPSSREV